MSHGVNHFLLGMALMICAVLYGVKHEARLTERNVSHLAGDIAQERELLRLLEAEWALRTEPDRLQRLADRHLDMAPVNARQIVTLETIPEAALPPLDPVQLARPIVSAPRLARAPGAPEGRRVTLVIDANPAAGQVAQNMTAVRATAPAVVPTPVAMPRPATQ